MPNLLLFQSQLLKVFFSFSYFFLPRKKAERKSDESSSCGVNLRTALLIEVNCFIIRLCGIYLFLFSLPFAIHYWFAIDCRWSAFSMQTPLNNKGLKRSRTSEWWWCDLNNVKSNKYRPSQHSTKSFVNCIWWLFSYTTVFYSIINRCHRMVSADDNENALVD